MTADAAAVFEVGQCRNFAWRKRLCANQSDRQLCAGRSAAAGLPETAVQVINTTDREAIGYLITMPEFVDVIVPHWRQGFD